MHIQFIIDEIMPHAYKAYGRDADKTMVPGWTFKGFLQPNYFGYVAQRDGTIMIANRGTETRQEWIKDATAIPTPCSFCTTDLAVVHEGFQDVYLSFRQSLLDIIAGLKFENVWIEGHSLGGALADQEAYDLRRYKPLVWTFAGPRTFIWPVSYCTAQKIRVTNHGDLVPDAPIFPFFHYGDQLAVKGPGSGEKALHSLDSHKIGLQQLANPRSALLGLLLRPSVSMQRSGGSPSEAPTSGGSKDSGY